MPDRKAVIIGAGPAGLAAGYQLSKEGIDVVCVEKDSLVGGISKTVCHNGFRFDIGGHRFFTKIKRVDKLWHEVLGENFLKKQRLSRIYYNNKFFNYPLKPANVIAGLGFFNIAAITASYIHSRLFPYPQEDNFQQWVSNRFGRRLFEIFFRTYTEKVWGMDCSRIEAEWAAQRIKGLSLLSAAKSAFFGNKKGKIRTLIEEFDYPRLGPGQMYQAMAEGIKQNGGLVLLNTQAVGFDVRNSRICALTVRTSDGRIEPIEGTDFLSSAPITDIPAMAGQTPDSDVASASSALSYRSLLTVNLMMNRTERFDDTWIYIHSPEVKVGRIQCFKNWSPEMVPADDVSSLGMEYFCNEDDRLWNSADRDLIKLARREIGVLKLADPESVFDAFVVRMPKTYPVYSRNYRAKLELLKSFVGRIENLQCIGRNGMFKYNNMDHSILSGLLASDNILGADNDLWQINTEQDYHEQESSQA